MTRRVESAARKAARHLDESVLMLELRRYGRIFASGRLPFVYAAAVLGVAWLLVPFLFGQSGLIGGDPISRYGGWSAGVQMTVTALAAGLAGYLRSQHLWQEQLRLRTLNTLLMTRQQPGRVAVTTVAMAALLGLGLVAVPGLIGLVVALMSGLQWWQYLLNLLLIVACALLGGAIGAAVFFIGHKLVQPWQFYPVVLAAVGLAVALWLRIESVERGWSRGWEEHPARIGQALMLATPVPTLFSVSAPAWWEKNAAGSLGGGIAAWEAALVYALLLLAASAYLAWLAALGYRRLAADPDRIEEKPRAPTEEAGVEYYWKGFRNPVWTRDIRTRLRSRDTAEFIFFASIAVAAGAFVPLLMATRDLSDPLQTARAARQVFFWLTMTLVALVTLVAPSLTADLITQERERGTLEMLVGTALRPREIITGKLLGAVCVMLLLISPSLPLFGLCYLFHGASETQVLQVYLLLLVTLTVASFLGLACSAINHKAGMAKFWAYGLTAVFVACPGGPFWIAAMVAADQAALRSALSNQGHVTVIIAVFWAFLLVLLWGNANEQLEYSEY